MIGLNSFGRSALFAAVAAAAWLPWVILLGPWIGIASARALYLVGMVAIYLGGLSAQPARALIAGAIALLGGIVLLAFAGSGSALVLGLAVMIAVGRSVFLYRMQAARAVLVEAALLLLAIAFMRWLASPTVLATSLSVWAFFLVQACFFLLAANRPRAAADIVFDPFEAAYRRAEALLHEHRG